MSTLELLTHLRSLGVRLWAEDGRLRYSARPGTLTPDLVAQLAARKHEILALFSESSGARQLVLRIVSRAGTDPAPLSFAQERVWFVNQLAPGNSTFNIDHALRLRYRLDPGLLTRALNEIVRRHETLRTVFRMVGDQPAQVVQEALEIQVPVVDLSHLPAEQREAETARLAIEESRRPFDLTTGPLLRTGLLRLGEADWVFLLTIHHIVTDGWSMGLFFRELSVLYSAFAMGLPSPLEELEVQYSDYAAWQREYLQGDVLNRLVRYWKTVLSDLSALELPTDRPRPALQTFRGAEHNFVLPAQASAGLKKLSQQEGATLFMTLLATFKTLLHRYSGQQDVVVGSYIANRNHHEVEPLIGFFVNTLVFRTDFSGAPTFREILRRVRKSALDAYAHQDIPFTKLVEELQPDRDLTRNPLFQVVFQLFNAPTMATDEMVEPTTVPRDRGTSIFDLALHTWEAGGRLHAQFEYNTDLFDQETILRLTSHFEILVQAIVANPDERVSALQLLTDEGYNQVTIEWNRTDRTFPLERGLVQLFEDRVSETPLAEAFSCRGKKLSYRELDNRANQIAHHLIDRGVEPGDMVGICIERSLEVPVALLAVLKANAVYVPLDPAYPKERLEHCLRQTHARCVVAASELSHLVPEGLTPVVLDRVDLSAYPATSPGLTVRPEALAYVMFTSGSTGRPKAVAVPHLQVLNRLHWMWTDYPWQPGEVGCQKTALNFVDSLWELLGGLLQGVPTVIIPDGVVKDVFELVETLARERVTRIWLVPSLLRAMLASVRNVSEELRDLKFWVSSGEALTAELFETFRRSLPGAVLFNLYGTSEVWDATWWDPRDVSTTPYRVPIGKPIANVRTYVLDTAQCPVPVGVCGELYVGGAGLASGYLDAAAVDRHAFIPDPLTSEPDTRLYRTGDLVRWLSDGNLEYIGRTDFQVKLRGHRVALEEVESVAVSCPGVEAAACAVRSDETGEDRLVAYVVPQESTGASAEDAIRSWREVWDGVYDDEASGSEPRFNTSGFVSSYTGNALPAREVREWVDEAVALVLSARPARVLELGCGAGLLLFRVAPHCQAYVGTDFSVVAIDCVRAQLAEMSLPVEVRAQAADDFTDIPEGSFDVVIIHSVAQYFPTIDYLVRVLERAVQALAPNGRVIIGDVRHRSLLEAFYLSVEGFRAPSAASSELWSRAQRRVASERELAIDPALFAALPGHLRGIRSVLIEPKRGKTANEFTRFRYNVVLQTAPESSRDEEAWIDWRSSPLTIEELARMLRSQAPQRVALSNVPNARVAAEYRTAKAIGANESQPSDIVVPASRVGLDPALVCEVAEAAGFAVGMRCCIDRPDSYDLVLECAPDTSRISIAIEPRPMRPWTVYANRPSDPSHVNRLVAALRRHFAQLVPDYMIPSVIMPLPTLPLSPNAKVNRRALPLPEWGQRRLKTPFVAPRNPVEQAVASLWSEILGVKQIGITDDFFAELGGHSLMATRLVSRIRGMFRLEFPLRLFFENPTVAATAEAIGRLRTQDGDLTTAIRSVRRERTTVRVIGGFVEPHESTVDRRLEPE